MSAAASIPVSVTASAPPRPSLDNDYAAFLDQAKGLTAGSVFAASELAAAIAQSSLPDATLRPLALAIGKASGLDGAAFYRLMLKARGAADQASTDEQKGPPLPCASDPDPAPRPKSLATAAEVMAMIINRRVSLTEHAAAAAIAWTIGTYGVRPPSDPGSGPDIFPRLHIFAPTKQCGKSVFLETIAHMVRRPLMATDVTVSVMFRIIAKHAPSIMIDEVDELLRKSPDLVGILNSGHARTGQVLRTVEVQVNGVRDFDAQAFPTFTPVALAGIGRVPSTVEDRSIRIEMQRQRAGTNRGRVGLRQMVGYQASLTPHLMAHANAIGAAMAGGVPDCDIPSTLSDRDADNWRPLLAIAKLLGPDWLARMQAAAEALCASGSDGGRGNEWALHQVVEFVQEKRLVAASAFAAWVRGGRTTVPTTQGRSGISRPMLYRFVASEELAAWLLSKDDSGFAEMRDSGAVKQRVARLLRDFGVKPSQRWLGGARVRGYDVSAIRAVWARYQRPAGG